MKGQVKFRSILAISVITAITLTSYSASANTQESTEQEKITYTTTQKRNVMYYGDWSIWGGQGNFYPKDIPADQLTHLNFAFLDFDQNGNLIFTDKDAAIGAPVGQEGVQWEAANAGILNAIQELRAKNPNMRIGVSVGGWSKSADFPLVTKDEATRQKFVDNLIKFIEYTNMDFIDIDWEFAGEVRQPDLVDNKNDEGNPYASTADKELFIKLLEDLREGIDGLGAKLGKTIELSVALPAPKEKVDAGINVTHLFDLVDFANIMTYDMRGAWDNISGHQAALYANEADPLNTGRNLSIDESVNYLIEQGAAPEKIVIGAAYYTRGWDSVEAGDNEELPGLYQAASLTTKDADQTPSYGAINEAPLVNGDGGRMSGVWSYRSLDTLISKIPGLTEYWDDTAKAPYLYDSKTGSFFTYDNVRSIKEKTDYVNKNNLGGVIGWMASQDAPTTSSKRDELTKATKEGLFGTAALPEYKIVHSDLDVTVSITPYEESWGTNPKGYEITVKNNEKAEESDSVLKEVERASETIKAPKLYIKSDKALIKGDYTAGTVSFQDGYTIVDLSSVWEAKTIAQGSSYVFKLKGDSTIEAIFLAQRMSTSGPDMYEQQIYGEKVEVGPVENKAPVLCGLSTKKIEIGEIFDALEGVSATDKEDGDLTATIIVEGEVNTQVAGEYVLTYLVTDTGGLTTTKTRIIKVVEPVVEENMAPTLSGITNKTISVGDSFDAFEGVSASDKEDGDLTTSIQVEGTVDTQTAGFYVLIYSVTDSEGLTTQVTRTVTVKEKENNRPFLSGIENVTIQLGESIDLLANVTAYDEEDGDLTSAMTVTGTVDFNTAGKYTITYSVTDSKGATTTATRVVTVKDSNADTFDINKVYNTGDQVIFNGATYTAKWWVQGEYPNQSAAWKKEVKPNEDGSRDYEVGMVFNGGELVKYNGKIYKAKWWTTSIPGSDDSWILIG